MEREIFRIWSRRRGGKYLYLERKLIEVQRGQRTEKEKGKHV